MVVVVMAASDSYSELEVLEELERLGLLDLELVLVVSGSRMSVAAAAWPLGSGDTSL